MNLKTNIFLTFLPNISLFKYVVNGVRLVYKVSVLSLSLASQCKFDIHILLTGCMFDLTLKQ